jgi:hypothetical protein
MIIANPIYDVVFKYLLDDMDITRELLATILNENIISVDVKPQEVVTEIGDKNVNIVRFDFKAIIRTADGTHKNILIELQKAKKKIDVTRFRRYLAQNYAREEQIKLANGKEELRPLPITTIYFLGFKLDYATNTAIRINREYRDAITGELILLRENFIELLTHDSIIIQVPQILGETRTRLEQILQIFSPIYETKNEKQLDYRGETSDPLIRKMIDRLNRANADEDLRRVMDAEEEVSGYLNEADERVFEAEENLRIWKLTSDKNLKDADNLVKVAEEEKKVAEEEKKVAEEEKKVAEEEKKVAEEEKKVAEEEKKVAEEKKKMAEEKADLLQKQMADLMNAFEVLKNQIGK